MCTYIFSTRKDKTHIRKFSSLGANLSMYCIVVQRNA